MIHVDYDVVTTTLNGAKIIVNRDTEKFVVPPTWTPEGAARSLQRFLPFWDQWQAKFEDTPNTRWLKKRVRHRAEGLVTATREAFIEQLAALLAERHNRQLARATQHILMSFWAEGCLCFPASYDDATMKRVDKYPFYDEHLRELVPMFAQVQDFYADHAAAGADGPAAAKAARGAIYTERYWFLSLMLTTQGVRQFTDLCPKVVRLPPVPETKRHWARPQRRMVQAIVALQGQEGHNRYTHADFRPTPRRDRFAVAQRAADLALWTKQGEVWLTGMSRANAKMARCGLGRFLSYLAENPHLPRNPVEYLDRSRVPDPLFKPEGQMDTYVIRFLEWVLTQHCTLEDDRGLPYINPGFANPLADANITNDRAAETHRSPMPTRLLDACITVLSKNDYGWAKQQERDYFRWLNPDTGVYERVWSPVRAYALMVKLLTPARTAQVRWLDSGEVDSFVYDPATGWRPNTGRLAPRAGSKPVERGVLRRYTRMDGTQGAVLYFNTNKTREQALRPDGDFGYVMPWEHHAAIAILVRMRDWQQRYYPLPAPVLWSEVREIDGIFAPARVQAMGSSCFLFRDPCNEARGRWRPVTDGRLRALWLRLLAEVERRLRATGEDVRLIQTWGGENGQYEKAKGWPVAAVFDLHSLRVTMISSLYKQGIPAEVLMKVVGHASVLMTLYYTKFHPQEVTDQIAAAQQAAQRDAQDRWIGTLRERPPAALSEAMAYSNSGAADTFANANRAGFLVMDHGICPVGAARCHEGLVKEGDKGTAHGPVPGGAANCTRCRFFVTGVPFLVGLVAHVNDLSYRARRLSADHTAAKDRLAVLENEQLRASENGEPFTRWHDLRLAATGADVTATTLDDALLSLVDAIRLAKQCEALAQREVRGDGYSLVAAGGVEQIEIVLREAHELEQLQRVCASGEVYDSLRIDWREANLRRARHFDRMLRDIGRQPVFVHLDEATIKRVGEELGRLLYQRLKPEEVATIADGHTTLRRLGVEQAIMDKLDQMAP